MPTPLPPTLSQPNSVATFSISPTATPGLVSLSDSSCSYFLGCGRNTPSGCQAFMHTIVTSLYQHVSASLARESATTTHSLRVCPLTFLGSPQWVRRHSWYHSGLLQSDSVCVTFTQSTFTFILCCLLTQTESETQQKIESLTENSS